MFGVSITNDQIQAAVIENINTQMKIEVFLNKYFNNFKIFRDPISKGYIKTAAKLIVSRRKHTMCLENYNGFLNETKLLKPELFSYKKWKDITHLFINNALFKASVLTSHLTGRWCSLRPRLKQGRMR